MGVVVCCFRFRPLKNPLKFLIGGQRVLLFLFLSYFIIEFCVCVSTKMQTILNSSCYVQHARAALCDICRPKIQKLAARHHL